MRETVLADLPEDSWYGAAPMGDWIPTDLECCGCGVKAGAARFWAAPAFDKKLLFLSK